MGGERESTIKKTFLTRKILKHYIRGTFKTSAQVFVIKNDHYK